MIGVTTGSGQSWRVTDGVSTGPLSSDWRYCFVLFVALSFTKSDAIWFCLADMQLIVWLVIVVTPALCSNSDNDFAPAMDLILLPSHTTSMSTNTSGVAVWVWRGSTWTPCPLSLRWTGAVCWAGGYFNGLRWREVRIGHIMMFGWFQFYPWLVRHVFVEEFSFGVWVINRSSIGTLSRSW